MSSKISYVTGALDDWFMVPDPESVRKAVEVYGQEAAQTVLDTTWMYRYVQYLALLRQLHSKPVEYCGAEKIKAITKMDNEYILCLWTSMTLVGTAQASLFFPASRPTVHISNVVVDVAFRGKGLGGFLMLMLRRRSRQRWQSQYGQLRYQLTSRAERGTQGFYKHLGFTAISTIRYER